MSIAYFALKKPITNVEIYKLREGKKNRSIKIWIHNELAGSLIVSEEECETILFSLLSDSDVDDASCPIFTSFGGDKVGLVVKENIRSLKEDMKVVSEYGELHTVGEVRSWTGRGKKDE